MAFSSTSLQSTLTSLTVKDLHKLCRTYDLSHTYSLKKAELVSVLMPAILSLERMDRFLYLAKEPEYRFFRLLYASDRPIPLIEENSVLAHLLAAQGYADIIKGSGEIIMPLEIQQMYQELLRNKFADRKRRGDLLDAYASAAVHLYGVIKLTDLVQIINQQNETQTTESELRDCLQRHIEESGYLFHQEYLVNEAFRDNGFQDVPDLLKQVGGKQRYLPPREKFLLYTDADYYEETPATAKLSQFLVSRCGKSFNEAKDITDSIAIACCVETPMSLILEDLNTNGTHLSRPQTIEFEQLVTAITKTSRLWSMNGHTPVELALMTRAVRGRKIGRNEPCPCGSGLKYKRCCGR